MRMRTYLPLLFLSGLMAPAHLPAQNTPSASMDLGVVTAAIAPGDRVEVPVTLVTRNEARVGTASLEVAYLPHSVSFLEAVLGSSAQGGILKAEEAPGEEGKNVIHVEIVSSGPLSEGLLVNLVFEALESITERQETVLENLQPKASSVEGTEIAARGLDGAITPVEVIPACLFYMH